MPSMRHPALVLVIVGCCAAAISPPALAASSPWRPDHIVVVMEENRPFSAIYGNTAQAPYLNSLIPRGAVFTQSYALTHPSQPNYFMLFSGSHQGYDGTNIIPTPTPPPHVPPTASCATAPKPATKNSSPRQ